MRILDYTIYRGRNIYSHRPVMKMIVDIGPFWNTPTSEIPGFNERLLAAFPGLRENCCGLGYPGGFLERLRTGTYLGHVLEHVILEMQAMLGYDVRYGKTRLLREPSVYYLIYEYENEVCGLECGKAAAFLLNCFLNGESVVIEEFLQYLRRVSVDGELGPSTSAIVAEAKARGIPVTRIGHESLVRLGYGRHSRLIESTLTDATPCICADISSNKQLTKALLCEHNIPVPYGKVVFSEISAVMAANQLGMPVVLKPFDGNQGKGVFLDLRTNRQIKEAFREAARYSGGVIVEKYVKGRDFRILVVGDKVSAVAERLPAGVTGDGVHTVRALIELVNADTLRGEQHEKPLTRIKIDAVAKNVLRKQGLSENSVPEKGRVVPLRENGNLSTGGTAIDCTDLIHPDNAQLAVNAAKAIGIDIAGIDVVTDDITRPITETGGAVVEVNTAPGIRMHLYPSEGKPRDVAKDIVDLLFPSAKTFAFPIVSVTGTNGKTTTVRLIRHVLALTGKSVGMTSTSGTFVGDKCVCRGDNSGPRSARALLANKEIDAAVLETARGGIVREGLGYDLADVGVITNIAGDHLGQDGIDTLEDLCFVKALVAEAVKEGGCAVLNAADGMTPALLKRVRAKVAFFAIDEACAAKPGTDRDLRVFVKDGRIRIRDRAQLLDVAEVCDIPVTCGGLIDCNIENCLAATAALYALHVPVRTIARGLLTFEDNAGRFNIYTRGTLRIMLDYGHNPSGFAQVVKACKKLAPHRMFGVIGMPGDRQDNAICEAGALCADAFDRIFIKEDDDLRGRKSGEVAELFRRSITQRGGACVGVSVILSELDALKAAVGEAGDNDLIVVFYENRAPLIEYLASIGAKPAPLKAVANRKLALLA